MLISKRFGYLVCSVLILLLPIDSSALSSYILKCDSVLLVESERIGLNQIGIIEKNNKDKIAEYLKSVGLNYPNAYCAAGQYYCFSQAASKIGLARSSIPILKNGLVKAIWNVAKSKGKKSKYELKRHGLLIWTKNGVFGHTERIVEVIGKYKVKTIAFNTKHCGQSGVHFKVRNMAHLLGRLKFLGTINFE